MSKSVTLGGERLGSGKKMQVDLKTYERSTHNHSTVFRSSMAAGTLVPFWTKVVLPGDTWDINMDIDVKTHPTIGPLFGSYKIQGDFFLCPVRLYQALLHNNEFGIGMKMANVKFPLMTLEANPIDPLKPIDNQQMNPSAIFAYLGIRGLGQNAAGVTPAGRYVTRVFNAVKFIAYWDVVKNYYCNKQEEIGAVLHTEVAVISKNIASAAYTATGVSTTSLPQSPNISSPVKYDTLSNFTLTFTGASPMPLKEQVVVNTGGRGVENAYKLTEMFSDITVTATTIVCKLPRITRGGTIWNWDYADKSTPITDPPQVVTFPLSNIDAMRKTLLANVNNANAYVLTKANTTPPYSLALQGIVAADNLSVQTSKMYSQEGLALKTYQSDWHNNWLKKEIIVGPGSISEITAISTAGGSFTIDTFILSKKVWNMLNRIQVSGGSYNDWLDAVYDANRNRQIETPVYIGGMIRELAFQEVVSNSASTDEGEPQPLGTLAGKGVMAGKQKGGKISVRIDEPGYIIGIVSITPRIDYSQGNDWDVNLKTMDDFHKPALDQIGFQDLPTDQLAWWETTNNQGGTIQGFQSAGKQPAWIQYMTDINRTYGNFADPGNEMFMTLNRRYELNTANNRIKDLTTYIDPVKFNYIFAQTSRDAQNFWVQIGMDVTARRKMSAKIMPNL